MEEPRLGLKASHLFHRRLSGPLPKQLCNSLALEAGITVDFMDCIDDSGKHLLCFIMCRPLTQGRLSELGSQLLHRSCLSLEAAI